MAQLQCKTLGDVSPRGKARVYFACHPEDHKGFFQEIREDLQKYSNCAVYYYDEEPERDEEYYANLERMQLFVMPVTTRLLYQPNRAMDVEFAYAMEHHIPVLPLMQEPGLEEKYAQRFGNLQYLDKGNRDLTAIPYEEKLKKYLDAVLLNDEMTAQVRAAFDAWIFLSYRKKDRKAAQELMRLIHNDPRCRDIAIWYDEFLNPGEDFSEAIRKALAESQLFVLAVTPNLLEKGNYVMREEYPEARKAGKPILPAEMEQTDRDALKQDFDGLPEPLNPSANDVLTKAILDALGSMAIRENDEDPRHNFFIGLAYLSGLYVEKDHPRAVKLITQAAEAGLVEAMVKLHSMYEHGEGVPCDSRMAVLWGERITELAHKEYEKIATPKAAMAYFECLWTLSETWRKLKENDKAKQIYQKMFRLAEEKRDELNPSICMYYFAVCYFSLAEVCMEEFNLCGARKWYRAALEIFDIFVQAGDRRYLREAAVASCNLGNVCKAEGKLDEAQEWYTKGREVFCQVASQNDINILRDFALSDINLGDICMAQGDMRGAQEKFQKALFALEKLMLSGAVRAVLDTAVAYQKLGYSFECEGKIGKAKECYLNSLMLCKQLDLVDSIEKMEICAAAYNHLGNICADEKDWDGAQEWYQKGHNLLLTLARTGTLGARSSLSSSYTNLGDVYEQINDIEHARKCYLKALQIDRETAKTGVAKHLRQLSITYSRLADLCCAEENYAEAKQWNLQCMEVRQKLTAANSIRAWTDLACCYESLGDICHKQNNLTDARKWYVQCYEIGKKLMMTKSVESFENTAAICYKLGSLDQDYEMLRKARELYGLLYRVCPEIPRYQRNMAVIEREMTKLEDK